MMTSEISLFTINSEYWHGARSLQYQRVNAVELNGRHFGDVENRICDQTRTFKMPGHYAIRLVRAFGLARNSYSKPTPPNGSLRINCYLFARLMGGLDLSLDAPFTIGQCEPVTGNLKLGELGAIGYLDAAPEDEPHHSIVGMDENRSEVIQEMWGTNIIGLCTSQNLLHFMQSFSPTRALAVLKQVQS